MLHADRGYADVPVAKPLIDTQIAKQLPTTLGMRPGERQTPRIRRTLTPDDPVHWDLVHDGDSAQAADLLYRPTR